MSGEGDMDVRSMGYGNLRPGELHDEPGACPRTWLLAVDVVEALDHCLPLPLVDAADGTVVGKEVYAERQSAHNAEKEGQRGDTPLTSSSTSVVCV